MLNLSNFPNNEVCGLSTDELNWAAEQSSERFLNELSNGFLSDLAHIDNEQFPELNEVIENELQRIEEEGIPDSSKAQMKRTVERFKTFLKNNNLDDNIERVPPKILNNYLRFFYSELKTKDGKFYAPKSLICFRAALHRYFSSPSVNRSDINILSSSDFSGSNRILKTMVGKYLSSNPKETEKYPPIEASDMVSIRNYFDRNSAKIIQEEVIFNLIYFFGLRGREILRFLRRNYFELKEDSTGKRYFSVCVSTLSKTAKASLSPKEFETLSKCRMYENIDFPDECPVTCFSLHLSMLPPGEDLFYKPSVVSKMAFTSRPLGIHSIDNIMPSISVSARLSKRYTNHCIRVTVVNVMQEQGCSSEEIALVTGHKNPRSVLTYYRKRRDETHQILCETLQVGTSKTRKLCKVESNSRVEIQAKKDEETGNTVAVEYKFLGNFKDCVFHCEQK